MSRCLCRSLRCRTVLAVAGVCPCLVGALPVESHARQRVPDCARGGATVIASDGLRGKVLVVRQRQRPLAGQSSRSRVFGCWRPTGRRFLIRREHEAGLDLAQPTTATVRRGRYIGIVKYSLGGQASFALAEVWDARSHRRLYDSRACGRDSTIEEPFGTEAVEEVVFLGDGEMAYACDQLRFADRHGDRQIAPRGKKRAQPGRVGDLAWGTRSAVLG